MMRFFAGARLGFGATLLAAIVGSLLASSAVAADDSRRLVVILYPQGSNAAVGNRLVEQGVRAVFDSEATESIDIFNEYLELSSSSKKDLLALQAEFLQRKYAGRKVALVMACVSPALDFALEHRQEIFPGVPIVFMAVEERELAGRKLPPDVIGTPIKLDLGGTLDLALRLHPGTQHVYVISGSAKFDSYWEGQARQEFRPYESQREFIYRSGVPIDELSKEMAHLPPRSLVYTLFAFQDRTGKELVPADFIARLANVANAPVYCVGETFVGRGTVGGHVVMLENAARTAARLGLRVMAGEPTTKIGLQPSTPTASLFDWRQLQRWHISEADLPPDSVVRYKELGFWDLYKWPVIGVVALCSIEALLIVGLLVQRVNRRRAERRLQASERELRSLTGRLLQAQETERGRLARELHDDLNQNLALVSVELELLRQRPPSSPAQLGSQLADLLAKVKHLSSSVHNLSHQLHPAKLEQLGLVAAVRSLCKELKQTYGVPIEFSYRDVPETLPPGADLCLYRIAQEALANVIKHSGAAHAAVELHGDTSAIRLRILDDGRGFEAGSAARKGGLGLVSMRERLQLVGGNLAIEASPTGGTRIDATIPLTVPGAQPVRGPSAAETPATEPAAAGSALQADRPGISWTR
jgi:signal transduction histidine kinase